MSKLMKTGKNNENCKGCAYQVGHCFNMLSCGYYDRTGQRRNCKVGECNKYTKCSSPDEKRRFVSFGGAMV